MNRNMWFLKIVSLLSLLITPCHSANLLAETSASDVAAVRVRLEDEKGKRLLMENDVEVLMMKIAKLEREMGRITAGSAESIFDRTRTTNSTVVAFHAGLSGEEFIAASNQTYVFDFVKVNIGDAYNATTGVFRAPLAGTYVFTSTALARTRHTFHGKIMKNGEEYSRFYASKSSATDSFLAQTVVMNLVEGDIVYIKQKESSSGGLYGHNYSWFAGFRLG